MTEINEFADDLKLTNDEGGYEVTACNICDK